jgi:hypothetical protein
MLPGQVLPQSGGAWMWRFSGSWWLRGAINQRSERRKTIDNHRDLVNKNHPDS